MEGDYMREGEGMTQRTYMHDPEQRGAGSGWRCTKCGVGYGDLCKNFSNKNIVKHHSGVILNT